MEFTWTLINLTLNYFLPHLSWLFYREVNCWRLISIFLGPSRPSWCTESIALFYSVELTRRDMSFIEWWRSYRLLPSNILRFLKTMNWSVSRNCPLNVYLNNLPANSNSFIHKLISSNLSSGSRKFSMPSSFAYKLLN